VIQQAGYKIPCAKEPGSNAGFGNAQHRGDLNAAELFKGG
jgi:hypothetical protein